MVFKAPVSGDLHPAARRDDGVASILINSHTLGMWLFTRHGFYSMTRSVDEPDKIQVRARSKGDLVNLKKIALVEVPY